MRGAFGKPQGTVARVHIGQPIMSIRTKDQHEAAVLEALRRAKFKFPGRQKVSMLVDSCFGCDYLANDILFRSLLAESGDLPGSIVMFINS